VEAVEPAPRPVAPGLSAALVRLAAPSCRGAAAPGHLVAFGPGALRAMGPQVLDFPSGLRLSLRHLGGGEVAELGGTLAGRPLDLPDRASLRIAGSLPSVSAGSGPVDG
jgi:hypothetical protein